MSDGKKPGEKKLVPFWLKGSAKAKRPSILTILGGMAALVVVGVFGMMGVYVLFGSGEGSGTKGGDTAGTNTPPPVQTPKGREAARAGIAPGAPKNVGPAPDSIRTRVPSPGDTEGNGHAPVNPGSNQSQVIAMDRSALGALVDTLESGSWNEGTLRDVRRYAIQYGLEFTHSELEMRMSRTDRKLGVAVAISRVAASGAYETLMNLTYSVEPADRAAGVQALYLLGETACIQEFRGRLIRDEDVAVRKETAKCLGKFRDQGSIEPLIYEGLSDPDKGMVRTAHWALGQITGQTFSEEDVTGWRNWYEKAYGGRE